MFRTLSVKLSSKNLRICLSSIFCIQNKFNEISKLQKHDWELYIDICLERIPKIRKPEDHLSLNFEEFFLERAKSKSRLSDAELVKNKIINRQNELNKLILERKISQKDLLLSQSSEEFHNISEKVISSEYNSFIQINGDKKTPISDNGIFSSRSDYKTQYLLIKPSFGIFEWRFPHSSVSHVENKSLSYYSFQAIEKLFCKPLFMMHSNYPLSFLQNRRDDNTTLSPSIGMKIFFTKAMVLAGEDSFSKENILQIKWCTKDEIFHLVSSKYYSAISHLMYL